MLLLISCGNSREDTYLSQQKMVDILIDMHINEAKVENLSLSRDSSSQLYQYLEEKVLERHQVSDSVYSQSMNYYMSQPRIMNRIYMVVVDSLSLRERLLDQK
jgi:hypothetical protein